MQPAIRQNRIAMGPNKIDRSRQNLAELRRQIRRKWPTAAGLASERLNLAFGTGIPALDSLFPHGGIPCGQLLELTGGPSSGKTTLLLTILAALTRNGRAVYIDPGRSFFPAAAAAAGIDLDRLLTVAPTAIPTGLRVAELLLKHNIAPWIVLDLVGQTEPLPMIMLHRLRIGAGRARGLIFFLTENNSGIIPPSLVALRLEINRIDRHRLGVTVAKSRISREGVTVEVPLET